MAGPSPTPPRRPAGPQPGRVPQPGGQPVRRPGRLSGRRRRWPKVLALVVLCGVLLVVGALAVGYALTPVPKANEIATAQTTIVFYDDGRTELGRFQSLNRTNVPLGQVPAHVRNAVIAAEDRTFYTNRGISVAGVLRAFWSNLHGNATQGGSTITQQYVKQYYVGSQRTYTRKMREAFIALKINRQLSKEQILTDYLNTIYFGRGAYGVQAAAQAYFGADVAKLSVAQGALLAGVINSPSNYDPRVNAAQAQRRFGYVLDGMVRQGWLSAGQRAGLKMPATIQPRRSNASRGPNGYLLETVRREMRSTVGLNDDEIDRGGFRVVTTFRPAAQAAAVEAVDAQLPPANRPSGLQIALASIDPGSGGVVAMYGGADWTRRQRNAVTQDVAQAGSTFKPFALVAALKDGISLRSGYSGASPMTVRGFQRPVRNFGNRGYGDINLITATANSVNTVYAQLNVRVGPDSTRQVAVDAGYPVDTAGLEANPANVLGTSSPHPIDVAQAFATFAARGVKIPWHTVSTVRLTDGRVRYSAKPVAQRVFDEGVMDDATYAMEQVVRRGSGSYALNLGRPAAGKTGTSTDNLSAWFTGFTPQLATAVALYQIGADGNPKPLRLPGVREVTGGSFPVRIWTSYMRTALRGQPVEQLPDPVFGGRTINPPVTRTPTPSSSTSTASASPTGSGAQSPGTPGSSGAPASTGPPASSTRPAPGSRRGAPTRTP